MMGIMKSTECDKLSSTKLTMSSKEPVVWVVGVRHSGVLEFFNEPVTENGRRNVGSSQIRLSTTITRTLPAIKRKATTIGIIARWPLEKNLNV